MTTTVTSDTGVQEIQILETLKLSTKVREALIAAGLDTLDKLVEYEIDNSFTAIPGIGDAGEQEIKRAITAAGDGSGNANATSDVNDTDIDVNPDGVPLDSKRQPLLDPEEPGISMGERGRRRERIKRARLHNQIADEESATTLMETGEPQFVVEWRGHVLRIGPDAAEKQYPELHRRVKSYIAAGTDSDPISEAATRIAADEHRRAGQDEEYERSRYIQYAIVLSRINNPQESDPEFLADFHREFQISAETMREHVKIINRGKLLIQKHSALEEKRLAMATARDNFKETRKRCEQEVETAEREFHLADREHTQSRLAAGELVQLQRRMPHLFELSGGVPVPAWIDGIEE